MAGWTTGIVVGFDFGGRFIRTCPGIADPGGIVRPESLAAAEAFLLILYNITNTMSDGSGFVEEYRHLSARETFLNTGHEDAVERVREAAEAAGFGRPMEFSPSENVGEHTGEAVPQMRVIGIGNPHAGKSVAELTGGDAATLFPCSVVVQAVESGRQRISHVSLLNVLEAVGLAPDGDTEEWQDALETASEGVAEIFERLESAAGPAAAGN